MSEFQSHHCMFEQIKWVNHIRTAVHDHPQLSLKCRLPNRISFDVFDRCFCKVDTMVCETLLSCAKRLGDLAVTTLPGASRSFNPALTTVQMEKWPQQGYTSSGKIHIISFFRLEVHNMWCYFHGLDHKIPGCFCLEVAIVCLRWHG